MFPVKEMASSEGNGFHLKGTPATKGNDFEEK